MQNIEQRPRHSKAYDAAPRANNRSRTRWSGSEAQHNHPDAARIVEALHGNPRSGMCFCPCHDNHRTPALHVSYRDGKLLVKCFAGCAQDTLVTYFKDHDLWPTKTRPVNWQERAEAAAAAENALALRYYRAMAVLQAGVPDSNDVFYREDTGRFVRLGGAARLRRYLHSRGIDHIPGNALWLPATAARRLKRQFPELGLKSFPAMLFAVERNGKVVGAHLTQLCSDGVMKLASDKPRRTLGPVRGGYILFGRNADSEVAANIGLVIGEGVETTLAAMQFYGLPSLAALSADNLPNVNPPRCREIIIVADNDLNGTGIEAARELMRKLNRRGIRVRIDLPERPRHWKGKSYDFADYVQQST